MYAKQAPGSVFTLITFAQQLGDNLLCESGNGNVKYGTEGRKKKKYIYNSASKTFKQNRSPFAWRNYISGAVVNSS